MALEFICSDTIESGKKIILPRHSNIYKLDFSANKISFYYHNSETYFEFNTWEIPKNARQMDFEFNKIAYGGNIIIPRFYDRNSKLLKIGNR